MATTLLNLPPSTPSNNDTGSDPDGHEGQHLHTSMDIAADRVARLGGIPTALHPHDPTTPTKDYFEPQIIPHTPGSASIVSSLADEHGSIEGEAIGANSTQAKRESMAAVLARRQLEQQQQQMLNQTVPTISTINTAPTVGSPAGSMNSSTHVSTIAPAVSPLPRAINAPDGHIPTYYGGGGGDSSSRSADSPASIQTTPSAAEARVDAKLIDGMTYDEGDTTGEGLGRRDTLRPGQFPSGLGNLNGRDEDASMD
ncbi:hypothetical protein AA313_de0203903 [Arthrobotrys entomopaga]|nr:hypothetical protein AA313_de0203903 [Arthrobotrys entomopaga]